MQSEQMIELGSSGEGRKLEEDGSDERLGDVGQTHAPNSRGKFNSVRRGGVDTFGVLTSHFSLTWPDRGSF